MSTNYTKPGIFSSDINTLATEDKNGIGDILQSNGIYRRKDIQKYTKFSRFGYLDPHNNVNTTREYLFFTKPDLHLCIPNTNILNPQLSNNSHMISVAERYPEILYQLQKSSAGGKDYPLMNLLTETVRNTLDLPDITAGEMDTPATMFGSSFDYRTDGYISDEKVDFTLEFEDTKYTEVYTFFRTIEEYARLKKIGIVSPPNINNAPEYNGYSFNSYIANKELHDQFSIYKIIVGEDMETIIFIAKIVGVFPKNVPRSSFSDISTEGGLKYSVDFRGAVVDDITPLVVGDFNELVNATNIINTYSHIPIYSNTLNTVDGRWVTSPYIIKVKKDSSWLGPTDMQYYYKLKWGLKK